MNKYIEINNIKIGKDYPPYIVAEMSANHNGSIKNAFEIIDIAKSSGSSAIKIQTYTPDTLTIKSNNSDFQINKGLWKGKSLYDLYSSAYTPWEWHKEMFQYANDKNITMFSSPFDRTAVDLLENINCPAYKIASFELVDIPLIKYVASTGKPMIMSTGMANFQEIEDAVFTAKDAGCDQLALLHCVSAYPAPQNEYNLNTIPDMIDKFKLVVGLSDHTLDLSTSISSVSLGASIIEKHFTLNRDGGGPDDSFSIEPNELKYLCKSSKTVWESLGKINYDRTPSEVENLIFRRSLYFVKDIRKGEIISDDHVRSIRPGYGMAPKYLDKIIGQRVNQDISEGTRVNNNLISSK